MHIDIDRSELHKIKNAHVAIHANVKCALEALLPRVQATLRKRWLSHVDSLKTRFPMQFPGQDDPRTHYGLIQAVAAALDDRAIVATDVGQHQMWVAQAYPFRRARQWLTSAASARWASAGRRRIGAALAEPDRTVVCFTGDGSFKMNIQELATLAEEGLNVKIVPDEQQRARPVGTSSRRCSTASACSPRSTAPSPTSCQDRRGLRRGGGGPRWRRQPARRARRGAASSRSGLIHATIDREQFVYPMVPPGAANTEMIGG